MRKTIVYLLQHKCEHCNYLVLLVSLASTKTVSALRRHYYQTEPKQNITALSVIVDTIMQNNITGIFTTCRNAGKITLLSFCLQRH